MCLDEMGNNVKLFAIRQLLVVKLVTTYLYVVVFSYTELITFLRLENTAVGARRHAGSRHLGLVACVVAL